MTQVVDRHHTLEQRSLFELQLQNDLGVLGQMYREMITNGGEINPETRDRLLAQAWEAQRTLFPQETPTKSFLALLRGIEGKIGLPLEREEATRIQDDLYNVGHPIELAKNAPSATTR